jgi:drug/metabolite transporter (DMT)-like permease
LLYQGELAAVGAAIVWAIATWIYSRFSHHFSALQLNIVKGLIASMMMLVVLPFMPSSYVAVDSQYLWILGISGVIGIAIGDSAYFASLKRIGANKTLLLESLAPPLSGILALAFLGTALALSNWMGVLITTIAVASVVFQPGREQHEKTDMVGVGYGLLASICQASGVVISHFALVAGDLPPLLGALIRLLIGVAAVALFIPLLEDKPYSSMKSRASSLDKVSWFWLLTAIFVGTFLALWLQQIALKHANPAVAQTLIATSPLFILVIYAIKGQPISKRSLLGTIAALCGISLFFL